jgi:DNA topoisomerase IA
MTPSQSHTKTYTIEAENTGSPSSSSSSSSSSPVHAIDSEDGAAWEGYNVLPGEDIHLSVRSATFRCSHTVNTFPGFLAVYDLRDNGAYEPTPLVPISQVPVGAQVWLHDNDDSKDDEGDDDEDGISIDDGSEAVEGADRNNRKESSDAEETSDAVDVSFHGVRGISHVTRPPSRFTDASFIKELETVGVGRPSTYSKIFSILRERNYAFVSGRTMIPTITGLVVANLLEKHFADFIQPDFTASMEDALDDIAKGHVDKVKFLSSFYLGDQSNLGMLPKVRVISGRFKRWNI